MAVDLTPPQYAAMALLEDSPGISSAEVARRSFVSAQTSDRLVDALVAWGDLDTVSRRISEYRAAGADQVALTVLAGDGSAVPIAQWRELAGAVVPGPAPGG